MDGGGQIPGGGGGGGPLNLGSGCAAECLGTWPCSRLKRHNFATLFQTENEMRLTFESETACLSKHAAGPEREQQQRSFVARFCQQNSHPNRVPESEWQEVYPVPDINADL